MEHLTKNTEYDEHLDWCTRCQKFTQHRRKPGERSGHCVAVHPPTPAQLANERRHTAAEQQKREQIELFPANNTATDEKQTWRGDWHGGNPPADLHDPIWWEGRWQEREQCT